MCTTLYYSSYKFSKFIQGQSPLLQQLASVSLLKEKSKICPELKFSPGKARPFMFAALCQRAHPLKHSLAEYKTAKKSSLAEKFVIRVTRQPRYHCICCAYNVSIVTGLWNSETFNLLCYLLTFTDRTNSLHCICRTRD